LKELSNFAQVLKLGKENCSELEMWIFRYRHLFITLLLFSQLISNLNLVILHDFSVLSNAQTSFKESYMTALNRYSGHKIDCAGCAEVCFRCGLRSSPGALVFFL
jgi:hypothetical protein